MMIIKVLGQLYYNRTNVPGEYWKEDSMQRIFSFFAGVITGSLVGATVAILFAPASGENARMQIQTRYGRMRNDIMAVAAARRAELERELNALRSPNRKEERG
jgi:hypothetical protein